MHTSSSTQCFEADDLKLDASPRVLVAGAYLRELVREVNRAKYRVLIVTLLISYDHETVHLFEALVRALRRGVEVCIIVDGYYTRVYFAGRQQRIRKTMQALELLRELRATVHLFGRSSINPFKGRCHSKFVIIDDSVYGFGGVNISDKAVRNNDYMLRWINAGLADRLHVLCATIRSDGTHPDESVVLDEHSTVLIDGGNPGESIIYQQACELVRQSRRVYYVSQFCPTGPLARQLFETNANYYFNRCSQAGMHIGAMLAVDKVISGIRTSYRDKKYLHAKFLLAERDDGSRVVLTGSHNFKQQGIKYGTKEIALYSTDQRLWDQLFSYLLSDVIV